ncbi:MAG: histone deacetylase family protein [Rhodospirillaceae bacterium]|jgi:acetoin utilization deacetylase AcuC-like enzyme|nr:histone deacetylase family protein [Rhodospirillaceae bacterium]MBT5242420.1 histone deacetylase family protein [Rhodospirillaceae bacterium]MBT5565271.1 histone deacetylase family protein [Rhodospirillaceae bacterium]MBT6091130.1 histone deacetylase family protein [Rhodospirillaceae bacterium]MBT6961264.1 histone deacetylase family protein [Rhodospirillaceae bacterium]
MTVLYVTDDIFLSHDTGPGHPESVDRLRSVHSALDGEDFAGLTRRNAIDATDAQMAAPHSDDLVQAILEAAPEDGYRHIDPDTVMSPHTDEAIRKGAGALVSAVDAVALGEVASAFCAVRPPGHHAERGRPMGFCFVNNIAVAALHARAAHGYKKIAVVDFDVHHGNGTQDIFWNDPDLFFASSHQYPHYPGTGAADEKGEHNNVVNAPLPAGTDGGGFRKAFEREILPALDSFAPDFVLISAGFDAHKDDPLSDMGLEEDDFFWATRQIMGIAHRQADGRVVSALEGGYNLRALGASTAAHVKALMKG